VRSVSYLLLTLGALRVLYLSIKSFFAEEVGFVSTGGTGFVETGGYCGAATGGCGVAN